MRHAPEVVPVVARGRVFCCLLRLREASVIVSLSSLGMRPMRDFWGSGVLSPRRSASAGEAWRTEGRGEEGEEETVTSAWRDEAAWLALRLHRHVWNEPVVGEACDRRNHRWLLRLDRGVDVVC